MKPCDQCRWNLKRFAPPIDKFNDIGNNLTRLNKSFNMGSAQSHLLPKVGVLPVGRPER